MPDLSSEASDPTASVTPSLDSDDIRVVKGAVAVETEPVR
jgi:hypothetical protein